MGIRECSGTFRFLPLEWVSFIAAQTVTKQPLFGGPSVLAQGQLLFSGSQFREDGSHTRSKKSGQMPEVGTAQRENFKNRERASRLGGWVGGWLGGWVGGWVGGWLGFAPNPSLIDE